MKTLGVIIYQGVWGTEVPMVTGFEVLRKAELKNFLEAILCILNFNEN